MPLGGGILQRRPIIIHVALMSVHEAGIAIEEIANCFQVSGQNMRENLVRAHGCPIFCEERLKSSNREALNIEPSTQDDRCSYDDRAGKATRRWLGHHDQVYGIHGTGGQEGAVDSQVGSQSIRR